MLQQYTPPKAYKSSRPYLSFFKSGKPSRSDHPLFPPPLEPLPVRPERPDTACSILTNTDGGDTHNRHYPPVTFASPVRRSDSRNASTPIPQCAPPTVRARSGTVQSSNTFGSRTPPKVIARDYGASPSRALPDIPVDSPPPRRVDGDSSVPAPTGPKARRRPSALRLQTSNLGPPEHMVSPGTPTPTPPRAGLSVLPTDSSDHPSSAIIRRKAHRRERRRSRSTGDLAAVVTTAHVAAAAAQHRVSRSESAVQLDCLPMPPPVQGRSEVYTPASTLSTLSVRTPGSEHTISPEKTSASGRFENVPLPWSTHPLSIVESALPASYLPSALDRLLSTAALVLSPDTFASLSSEETRLQLELDRLKIKHTRLSQHRDKLLAKSFARVQTVGTRDGGAELLRAMQEAVARVDRVSRQIFICNDQIRQMEVLKRDHEVGVLLWATQRAQRQGSPSDDQGRVKSPSPSASPTDAGEESRQSPVDRIENTVSTIPDIQLTRATVVDVSPQDDACEYLNSPGPVFDHDATYIFEVEPQDRSSPTTSAIADAHSAPDRPLSTLSSTSLSLSPINLGFPLPPSRPSFLPDIDTSLQVTFDPTPHRSTSLGGCSAGDVLLTPSSANHNHIFIYPPTVAGGQRDIPDMPYTPLRSEMDHCSASSCSAPAPAPASAGGGENDERPLPPLPPLRTRRSKPDLSVYIPHRSRLDIKTTVRQVQTQPQPRARPEAGAESTLQPQSEEQSPEPLIHDPAAAGTTTSPLRYGPRTKAAKYHSLTLVTESRIEGDRRGQKEFKRARESGLENPESILLSLATAELWMKEAFAAH